MKNILVIKSKLLLGLAVSTMFASAGFAEDITTVKITDKVILDKCKRFGINVGGDNPWEPNLKSGTAINFEGTAYRTAINTGPICSKKECVQVESADKLKQDTPCAHSGKPSEKVTTFMVSDSWLKLINEYGDATYKVLSGENKGVTGKIIKAEKCLFKYDRWRNGRPLTMYSLTLDKKIKVTLNDGIMISSLRFKDGQIKQNLIHYKGKKAKISNDVSPESYGVASLKLPANERFTIRVCKKPQQYSKATLKGTLLAKATKGSGDLTLTIGKTQVKTIKLSNAWKNYKFEFTITDGVSPWIIINSSSEVLIDDIEASYVESGTNPTAFRDKFINIMKEFKPGIIRTLQMGGGDIENFLQTKIKRHTYSSLVKPKIGAMNSHTQAPFTPSEYYAMCEYLDAEAWLNLPGTVSVEGISKLMEYLGAPADVGYGKLRAEQGHPKPFTETIKGIHIEFGNEIWNMGGVYYGCGYNGADFWYDLIEAGKNSPYYKKNIIFNVGGREYAGMKKSPTNSARNADRFNWAPYILHNMKKNKMELFKTDEDLVKWGFGRAIDNATNTVGGKGEMFGAQKKAKDIPLAIYEIHYHMALGKQTLSHEKRNVTQLSLAGGTNIANAMLMHLKYNGAFDQCYFGFAIDRRADFENRSIPWHTHYQKEGETSPRPSPQFLALSMVNGVIQKDLLETVHEGAKPVFSCLDYKKYKQVDNIPSIWSYGFKDGKKRGLVLVNLDLKNKQKIKVEFKGGAKKAKGQVLEADKFSDTNIIEDKVIKKEYKLSNFKSGSIVTVPPASILALSWEE